MRNTILITISLTTLLCINVKGQQQNNQFTNSNFLEVITSSERIAYTFKVYQLPNLTYAYVIYANGKKYLHQQNMPGKDASVGFSSKDGAEKVAGLVIKKLEIPKSLPVVSIKEMEQLNVK